MLKNPFSILFIFLFHVITYSIDGHWIDYDTSIEYHHKTFNDIEYALVFSDEFEAPNRSFENGEDVRWTSLDKNDYTNFAIHYYDSDMITTSRISINKTIGRSIKQNTKDKSKQDERDEEFFVKTIGVLNLTTSIEDKTYDLSHVVTPKNKKNERQRSVTKNYKSGMLQGWNKFCFTGGVVEISAQLPGQLKIGGLWPAIWLMGNLARATYVASSENLWPWSYQECDEYNQKGQAFSACNRINHFRMFPMQGRGAPEIDIMEAMPGDRHLGVTPVDIPYFSTSFQVSPAVRRRPINGQVPPAGTWYGSGNGIGDNDDPKYNTTLGHHNNHTGTGETRYHHSKSGGAVASGVHGGGGVTYGKDTAQNVFFYGQYLERKDGQIDKSYQADAVSANTGLKETHFTSMHIYKLDWEPPSDSYEGHMRWYVDDEFIYGIEGSALNITNSTVPSEPMYLILNTAMSTTWGFPYNDCPKESACYDCRDPACACYVPPGMCSNFPAHFLIDYIRVYQRPEDKQSKSSKTKGWFRHTTGCSTKEYPTKHYIEGNRELYIDHEEEKATVKRESAYYAANGDLAGTGISPASPWGMGPPILRPVHRGGGQCRQDRNDCNEHGKLVEPHSNPESNVRDSSKPTLVHTEMAANLPNYCDETSRCRCNLMYSGSHCRSQFAFDDVIYDYSDDAILLHPVVATLHTSPGLVSFATLGCIGFVSIAIYVYYFKPM